MLKSRIFIKAMLIVISMILIYTVAISIFTIPKVENRIKNLEEKTAKEVLEKVVMVVDNVHKDLEKYKQTILEKHKENLINLTDTIWSIIDTKYDQSKFHNVGTLLEKRSEEFKSNLIQFYEKNKDKMSENELKDAISNHINIYRYNEGIGYFWLNDSSPKMIVHPIIPELNGTDLKDFQDPDGKYIFTEMVDIVQSKNSGILTYKWLNPKSNRVENKISYVFKFEPFNWVIGTGEYYGVLKQRLQDEVFELISKTRYADDNYFFINDYNNIVLSHPYVQGKNFSNIRDKKGNLFVPSMVKIARENKKGFYSYWWTKKENDEETYEKLSFVRDFPDWKIIIGTGVYIDGIEREVAKRKKELMKQLREIIMNTKLGKTGYMYIFNKKGKMLIHPNENLDGNENFYKAPLPVSGISIYDQLVKASGTKDKSFYYKWDKPSDKGNYIYDKISWVEYIPELDWYIASSVYTEEFKDSANDIRDYVIAIALIVLLLSLTYSFVFFKRLLNPLNKLSKLVFKVSKGDYSIRYPEKGEDDEISILAHKFNEMIETIENRTREIEESNDELEQMVHNLKRTQNKLIEAEKMAGLGKLVAGVAHEINTPVGIGLTGASHLSFISEVLKEKYDNEEMTQEEFENYLKEANDLSSIIYSNLTKTSNIIKNFKQVAVDQTSEQKRIFDLKEYTKGVLFSLETILKKKEINIDINCEDNLNINSYPGQYSQILTNLIVNSIRHGFKTRNKGNIVIDISIKDNTIDLIYKDDGVGISRENLPQIFNPFFTTNREDGGSGLGLNIVYNIITNNFKGTIECKSKINEGTVFIIKIPLDSLDKKKVED